jgi:ABC-2 type transport system permease protein
MNIAIYLNESRAELTRAWRTPAFIVPTLTLPLAFYSLFGILLTAPRSGQAAYTLATYGVFAALGPALFGFGAGIAADRDAGILALKQVSPVPVGAFLCARLTTAATFTMAVLLALYALAAWGGGVTLPAERWLALMGVHLVGVAPFCLVGLCVGLRASGSVALALANILFVALAVLGGLWLPLFLFPAWLQHFALGLPTYHLGALALATVGGNFACSAAAGAVAACGETLPAGMHWVFLAAFTLALAAVARHSWAHGRELH